MNRIKQIGKVNRFFRYFANLDLLSCPKHPTISFNSASITSGHRFIGSDARAASCHIINAVESRLRVPRTNRQVKIDGRDGATRTPHYSPPPSFYFVPKNPLKEAEGVGQVMASLALSSATAAKATPNAGPSSLLPPSTRRVGAVVFSHSPERSTISICRRNNQGPCLFPRKPSAVPQQSPQVEVDVKIGEPLKVMISGAPASGKGTQCDLIKKKYGLVHIAAGDLLREEIAAGTEKGKRSKEYMEKGMLVPSEIVVMMVEDRLLQPDAREKGWLLDGYPRSLEQAKALEELGIRPDIFILLDVSDGSLVERVIGRRLDPETGKIYHLKYSPPENEEIAARLTHRFDDTEEKVKLRLRTHHENVEDVLSTYEGVIVRINGDAAKEDAFAEIDKVLSSVQEKVSETSSDCMAAAA